MNKEVDGYIAGAPDKQKEVLTILRRIICEEIPDVKEMFKWGQPVYATEKDFCYLKFTKQHVNLGFMDFKKIDDTENRLEGTGKTMRHMKIKNPSEINRTVISQFLSQAAKF